MLVVLLGSLVLQSAVNAPPDAAENTKTSYSSYMRDKIASLKPFPVGVVFQQDPRTHKNVAAIRSEFKAIKALGFTALKQIMLTNSSVAFTRSVYLAAIEEGLIPWWYGRAGWRSITPELLRALGIPQNSSMEAIQSDPRMIEYQNQVLIKRVERMGNFTAPSKPYPSGRYLPLSDAEVPYFASWLENKYMNMEALNSAWHISIADDDAVPSNFSQAAVLLTAPGLTGPSWSEGPGFFAPWGMPAGVRDFKRFMDAMRFRGEINAANQIFTANASRSWDEEAPVRCGGETMLLSNQPHNGWWRQGLAEAADEFGGFYDSMHLPWHYTLGNVRLPGAHPAYTYDADLTVQILARSIVSDLVHRDQWAGAFESTGGPSILSGGQGMTVDAAQIKKLMLSYTAVGLKGIGLWAWNSRWHGLEGGEYSLTDRQGKPSPRAIAAGKIATALQKHRFSLWEASEAPLVGILRSWTNEATWARLGSSAILPVTCAVSGCDDRLREQPYRPTKAMVGVSRVLAAMSIPFRFVTEEQLMDGSIDVDSMKAIVAPSALALNRSVYARLKEYVAVGGRLIADQPFGLFDEFGNTVDQTKTVIPDILGCFVSDYYDTSNGYSWSAEMNVHGIYGEIRKINSSSSHITRASSGWVSRCDNRLGSGSATFLNYEASQIVFGSTQTVPLQIRDGDPAAVLGSIILEGIADQIPIGLTLKEGSVDPSIIKRSAPGIDYIFVMNRDSVKIQADIIVRNATYKTVTDILEDVDLPFVNSDRNSTEINLSLGARDSTWLACTLVR